MSKVEITNIVGRAKYLIKVIKSKLNLIFKSINAGMLKTKSIR